MLGVLLLYPNSSLLFPVQGRRYVAAVISVGEDKLPRRRTSQDKFPRRRTSQTSRVSDPLERGTGY
jgi:hypothetical protein